MKVCIGADHAGFELKELIASSLREADIEVVDVGTNSPDSVDYPVYALRVARAVEEWTGGPGHPGVRQRDRDVHSGQQGPRSAGRKRTRAVRGAHEPASQ